MNQNARSIMLKSIVVVATIAVAWGLATGLVSIRQDAQFYEDRAVVNRNVLDDMGTINVGDTLSDVLFEDLSGEQLLLSSVVSSRTMLMVVSPGCPACLDELNLLTANVFNNTDAGYFLLISSEEPDILTEMRQGIVLQAESYLTMTSSILVIWG